MALTITYDGYGVVANADSLTADTAGGTWAESGGGTVSLNPDVYLYGNSSIGSKYASKSGFTYFTATTPLNFTTTELGQYIYMWVNIQSAGAFDILANSGFFLFFGSDTSNYYKFRVVGSDDANGWAGGWKLFVLDKTLGEVIGTPVDTAINTFGMWADTIVSVRADSIFQSQIMCAKGLKVEGTSTTMYNDIVAWCEDYANRAAGMFQSRGQTYYSLGSLTIHSDTLNTLVSADGSNVEYEKSEYYNGTMWTTAYPTTSNLVTIEATGGNTSSLTDTNIGTSGNDINKYSLVTTNATSYLKSGGYIKYLSSLTATSNDVFSGVVFSLYDVRTLGSESYTNCIFDGSSTLTVSSTATFTDNSVSGISGVSSLLTSDLANISDISFNSSGSNHGVELSSIGSGSMNWNSSLSGFDSGATGSPVTPTNTGNEAIYVNVASGTLTINVASGASIPSIRSAGATVNVLAGQVTLTIIVNDITTGLPLENAIVYVTASAGGSLAEGTVIIDKVLTDINGQVSDTRSYSSNQPITGRVRKSSATPYYKTGSVAGTISNASGLDLTIQLIKDE